MAANQGVPGVGVTPLVGGGAVTPSNPLPVTPGGFPSGVTVGPQLEARIDALAAGTNVLVAAVPTKRLFVTGYSFSLNFANTVYFVSTGTTKLSAIGNGVINGAENNGGEPFLFRVPAGEGLNFFATLADAVGSVQVRYRVEV